MQEEELLSLERFVGMFCLFGLSAPSWTGVIGLAPKAEEGREGRPAQINKSCSLAATPGTKGQHSSVKTVLLLMD